MGLIRREVQRTRTEDIYTGVVCDECGKRVDCEESERNIWGVDLPSQWFKVRADPHSDGLREMSEYVCSLKCLAKSMKGFRGGHTEAIEWNYKHGIPRELKELLATVKDSEEEPKGKETPDPKFKPGDMVRPIDNSRPFLTVVVVASYDGHWWYRAASEESPEPEHRFVRQWELVQGK